MCIASAAVTKLGEIKMSTGWCFIGWILDLRSKRIAAITVYLWPSGPPAKMKVLLILEKKLLKNRN